MAQSDRDKSPLFAPPNEAPVPPVVHQLWLQGESRLLPVLGALVDGARYRAVEAGWRHCLWREFAPGVLALEGQHADPCYAQPASPFTLGLPAEIRPLALACCHPSQRSNVYRYALLACLGGLWLDTDVEVWRLPRPSVLRGAWISAVDDPPEAGRVNPAVLAAPPAHPYLCRLLDGLVSLDLAHHMTAGARLCRACFGPDVRAWPRSAWQGRRSDKQSYGCHHGWGQGTGSFRRYLNPVDPASGTA